MIWNPKPSPDETKIVGRWVVKRGTVVADDACKRIEKLIRGTLEHVADHPELGSWEALFRDPADNRLWERTYPQSQMHGGGPPSIRVVAMDDARRKYRL